MFVSAAHTEVAGGLVKKGGDLVPGAPEVAASAVVDGMDCVRLAKCVSALEEKRDLLEVASAFVAQTALSLASHHVKNFTKALKRMHPAVGKAVEFAESGGVPVLDVVKHVGAGIASVLPLGVMRLAALVFSLLPENDPTTGIDWLDSAHAAFNVVSSAFVPQTSWYCWARRNRSCPTATWRSPITLIC